MRNGASDRIGDLHDPLYKSGAIVRHAGMRIPTTDYGPQSTATGGTNGICTHPAAVTEPNADYYTMVPT